MDPDTGQQAQRTPDELTTNVGIAMQRYMEETVAFHEIAKRLDDPDDRSKRLDNWIDKHRHLINEDDIEEAQQGIRHILEAFAEAISEHKAVSIPPSSESPEVNAYISTFIIEAVRAVIVDRAELVSRAFHVSAVSTFEVMFGSLAREIYRRNPAALARSEYSFTLVELERYTSIDEAREELISRRVDALLSDGVDAWLKWLNSTIKIDLASKVEGWPSVREIFARRNLIVHSDGKIDRRYIEILKQASIPTDDLHIGDTLDYSVVKLLESLERLIAAAVILAFGVWTRLDKTAVDAASKWELGVQEDLSNYGMWTAVRSISLHLAALPCSRVTQLRAKVYGWLAQKFMTGLGSISDEVSGWDVSGLDAEFRLSQSLLLDNDGLAASLLEDGIREGSVNRFEALTEPLYLSFFERNDWRQFWPQAETVEVVALQVAEPETHFQVVQQASGGFKLEVGDNRDHGAGPEISSADNDGAAET